MATDHVAIPDRMLAKVKEAAEREDISVEELVLVALERRIKGNRLQELHSIARTNAKRTGLYPEIIGAVAESEIAAYRNERGR